MKQLFKILAISTVLASCTQKKNSEIIFKGEKAYKDGVEILYKPAITKEYYKSIREEAREIEKKYKKND
jgi:hypothetical protein